SRTSISPQARRSVLTPGLIPVSPECDSLTVSYGYGRASAGGAHWPGPREKGAPMRARTLAAVLLLAGVLPPAVLAASPAIHPELSAKLVGSVEVPKGAPKGH